MIKLINKNTYRLTFLDVTVEGDGSMPAALNILKGIIDWYRKGNTTICVGKSEDRYTIVITDKNVHLIHDSSWPSYKDIQGCSEIVIKALREDLFSSIEKWAFIGSDNEKEYNKNLEELEELKKLIKMYEKATENAISWNLLREAENMYSEYIHSYASKKLVC